MKSWLLKYKSGLFSGVGVFLVIIGYQLFTFKTAFTIPLTHLMGWTVVITGIVMSRFHRNMRVGGMAFKKFFSEGFNVMLLSLISSQLGFYVYGSLTQVFKDDFEWNVVMEFHEFGSFLMRMGVVKEPFLDSFEHDLQNLATFGIICSFSAFLSFILLLIWNTISSKYFHKKYFKN